MVNRITKNEERLDSILLSIEKLEEALNLFKENEKNISLVNKYYGSKNWFKDKEAFEQGKIKNIKAGILSEDAVWDMNENIGELISEMRRIVNRK